MLPYVCRRRKDEVLHIAVPKHTLRQAASLAREVGPMMDEHTAEFQAAMDSASRQAAEFTERLRAGQHATAVGASLKDAITVPIRIRARILEALLQTWRIRHGRKDGNGGNGHEPSHDD